MQSNPLLDQRDRAIRLAAGATVNISLTRTNLTGASLATDNPGILVRNEVTTPTSIAATF